MNNFTLKDFIKYNNPCFNCGIPIKIKLRQLPKITRGILPYLEPIYKDNTIHFQILNNYNHKYSLSINIINHKLIIRSKEEIEYILSYLNDHIIDLESYCGKCDSSTNTYPLEFIEEGEIYKLKLIKIDYERLRISKDHKLIYLLFLDHLDKISRLTIVKTNTEIRLPILSLFKLKTKEKLLNKIEKLLIFL